MKNTTNESRIELYARDLRMVRGANDVLKNYRIERDPENKSAAEVVFIVSGGQKPYRVSIDPDWQRTPACTCPDSEQRARELNGGYCKHIIAVLLKENEFRCQLLDIIL